MDAIRVQFGPSEYLVVAERDVVTVTAESDAKEVARALIASPGFASDLVQGDPERLEEELVDALLSGRLVLTRVDREPRPLDPLPVSDLVQPAAPSEGVVEPPRPDAWIAVEVVDQRGRPLPWFRVQVSDPASQPHDLTLSPAARGRVGELAEDGGCEITLTVDAKPRA